MPTLRWTGDNLFSDLGRSGQILRPGNEIDVDPEDVSAYIDHRCGDDWEVLDDSGDATTDEDDLAAEAEEDLREILDGSVPDLEADLETGDYDDYLGALEDLEKEGQKRTTALAAIQSRTDEISEE